MIAPILIWLLFCGLLILFAEWLINGVGRE